MGAAPGTLPPRAPNLFKRRKNPPLPCPSPTQTSGGCLPIFKREASPPRSSVALSTPACSMRTACTTFPADFPKSPYPANGKIVGVRVFPTTIVRRQVPPRCTCPKNPERSIDKAPVVLGDSSPHPSASWQFLFQTFPCLVTEIVSMIVLHPSHLFSLFFYSITFSAL